MGSTSHTARSPPFLEEDRDPVPSTWAYFFLPTIGVTPKNHHQKTSGFSRPKSLCNEVTIYLSLKGSTISARLPKQVINLTTGFNCIVVRDKRTNERYLPFFPPGYLRDGYLLLLLYKQAHIHRSSLLWYTHLRIIVHFQIPFLFDSLEYHYHLLGHPLRKSMPKLRKDEIG